MTPRQIELARHALGLVRHKPSFRNHFVAGDNHSDFADWEEMVRNGDAKKSDGSKLKLSGGSHCYWLVRSGAEKALREGESLCPEDFPPVRQR